jgi:hypothetical protein
MGAGAGAAASAGGAAGAADDVGAGAEEDAGADEAGAAWDELVSDDAGEDEVLLHAVHHIARLRSSVDETTFLVCIETSFQWDLWVDSREGLPCLPV